MQKCGESARRPAEMATADLPKDSKPPLTLPPNFKCEKGSVTAAAAAYMPLRGSFVGENLLCNLRVILESYSTSGMRTLFFFCFFFSFQQRKKEA